MPAMALVSSSLPPKVDLSSKMPPAGNQGARGSCTAFAVAYGVRTYQVGLKKRWNLNRKNHIFSPAYVFNQLSYNGRGIHIHKAMQLVINQGCSTLNLMPYNPRDYRTKPNRRARNQASLYRAMKWARLNPKDKFMVKQLLSEGKVVVAAIYCFKYFMNRRYMARNNWVYKKHRGGRRTLTGMHGRHAVVVVGYDDNKAGGSFKIFNSWGKKWGNNGYFWIKYDFWNQAVYDMYILHDKKKGGLGAKPNPPLNVRASTGFRDKITISWKSSPGADGYEVYRFNSNEEKWYKLGTTAKTRYTDKTAYSGFDYNYSIKSFNKFGKSDFSTYSEGKMIKKTLVRKLNPPEDLTATKHLRNKIKLTWQKINSADSYKIYRWSGSKWYFKKKTISTRWFDNKIRIGKSYYYCVSALNKSGESKKSKYVTGKAVKSSFSAKPVIPSGLRVSKGKYSDRIKIRWRRVSNAASYVVYRWRSVTKKWRFIKRTKKTYYFDYKVKSGQRYYYSVASSNNSGSSKFTDFKYGYTVKKYIKGRSIPKLYNLKTTKGDYPDKVVLTWRGIGNEFTYCVYRWTYKKKWKQLKITSASRYVDRNVVAGRQYYYSIRVMRGNKYGKASDNVLGFASTDKRAFKEKKFSPYYKRKKPAKPAWVRAVYKSGSNSIKINWARAKGARRYSLHKWNSSTRKWYRIKKTTRKYYIDYSVKRGRTYYYAVYAINNYGKSGFTKYISCKTLSGSYRRNYKNNYEKDNNNQEKEED